MEYPLVIHVHYRYFLLPGIILIGKISVAIVSRVGCIVSLDIEATGDDHAISLSMRDVQLVQVHIIKKLFWV